MSPNAASDPTAPNRRIEKFTHLLYPISTYFTSANLSSPIACAACRIKARVISYGVRLRMGSAPFNADTATPNPNSK